MARHFAYLPGHGFRLHEAESGGWEDRATFISDQAAVAVIRSREFVRVEVQLMRLVDGALPTYPVFVVDNVAVNTFYLDDLLALRMPDGADEAARQRGLSDNEVEAQLAFWAASLERHGGDFLAGDLAVLDTLEAVVRARARQAPQEVVVWMPEGTDPEHARAEAERAAQAVPPGVGVSLRWYQRRPPT